MLHPAMVSIHTVLPFSGSIQGRLAGPAPPCHRCTLEQIKWIQVEALGVCPSETFRGKFRSKTRNLTQFQGSLKTEKNG